MAGGAGIAQFLDFLREFRLVLGSAGLEGEARGGRGLPAKIDKIRSQFG